MGLGNLTRWSHPTWYLFHGMAEQISDNFFNKNKKEVLNLYSDICNNLPCPYCRKQGIPQIDFVIRDFTRTFAY